MRRLAGWLIVLGLVLAIAGVVLWAKETEDTDRGNLAAELTGGKLDEPNRTIPMTTFVVGGLAVLGGVVLLAGKPEV